MGVVPHNPLSPVSTAACIQVTDSCIQNILRQVDTAALAVALKGQPEDLMKKVTANLSKGARATLAEGVAERAEHYLAKSGIADQAFFMPEHAQVLAAAPAGWSELAPRWTAEPMPWLAYMWLSSCR